MHLSMNNHPKDSLWNSKVKPVLVQTEALLAQIYAANLDQDKKPNWNKITRNFNKVMVSAVSKKKIREK